MASHQDGGVLWRAHGIRARASSPSLVAAPCCCSLLPAPCSLVPGPCSLLLLHAACSHRRREAASACSNPPHPAPRTHQQPHTLPSSHHFPSARTRSHRHLVYASWAPSVKGSAAVDAKTAHDDAAPMHALHMHDASLRCMNAYSHACMQPCMQPCMHAAMHAAMHASEGAGGVECAEGSDGGESHQVGEGQAPKVDEGGYFS